ncbi:transcription antitermination factor NusB [Alicyclobacillus tolerans]|uniref:transcription antitermination factor NusB n=1 Tax=Alicyclobacillus tolerans TaxID=90970 RepID=UPI001F02C59C|nr:transcription antitermination factor NusB [Alicyclobacillus tolerans]MCF8563596.1 transcription antitermination factor NusB [Alicyclobacillus tolerans]
MRRRELRQLALQALYQVDVGKADVAHAVQHVLSELPEVTDGDLSYVTRLATGTRDAVTELDELLKRHVQGWQIERIARVDLNILRLALFELLYERDVDTPTIMNEAVELAKHFSTSESSRFVNGVLARVLPAAEAKRE